jgi:hypothetical protein
VSDYSSHSFYGWSFRNELESGAVRLLEVSRARTPGAYLLATDLFANGRFSTMSHTVLMVFPRIPAGRTDLYALREDGLGHLQLLAPDGSIVLIDGETSAVLPTATFALAPLGPAGTPPGLRHRGLHLEIHSVGKSPFLRGTPVRVADPFGAACSLATDDVFLYGDGPESDVFRFDGDASFFEFLERRCPELRLPAAERRVVSVASAAPASAALDASGVTAKSRASRRVGGFLDLLRKLWPP